MMENNSPTNGAESVLMLAVTWAANLLHMFEGVTFTLCLSTAVSLLAAGYYVLAIREKIRDGRKNGKS